MKILGIETSCDETSAAIIDVHKQKIELLSNVVATSLQLHSKTGGIIPEIAAREQIKYILPVLDESFKKANITYTEIDAIAVTVGPGLIGSLLVGVETAKTLSLVWSKPIIPVNHLFGHIYANFIENPVIEFPALALVVSGGHTDLVVLKDHKKIDWIAGTRDDAAGEAFDKIGRLLGLSYPAGPEIETLAKKGNPKAFHFPRPLLHEDTLDFSFSGLKTAVLREVEKQKELRIKNQELSKGNEDIIFSKDGKRTADPRKNSYLSALSEQTVADLCRGAQDAIIEVLVKKTLQAAKKYNVKSVLLGGGVAANQTLKDEFTLHSSQLGVNFFAPTKKLCTDNAAMIAAAGCFNNTQIPWEKIDANPELYFD